MAGTKDHDLSKMTRAELDAFLKLKEIEKFELLARMELASRGVFSDVVADQPPPVLVDNTDWSRVEKRCPKCGKTGAVEPVFGTRVVRGKTGPQSWCSECRANTVYYRLKRKNNVAPSEGRTASARPHVFSKKG